MPTLAHIAVFLLPVLVGSSKCSFSFYGNFSLFTAASSKAVYSVFLQVRAFLSVFQPESSKCVLLKHKRGFFVGGILSVRVFILLFETLYSEYRGADSADNKP